MRYCELQKMAYSTQLGPKSKCDKIAATKRCSDNNVMIFLIFKIMEKCDEGFNYLLVIPTDKELPLSKRAGFSNTNSIL